MSSICDWRSIAERSRKGIVSFLHLSNISLYICSFLTFGMIGKLSRCVHDHLDLRGVTSDGKFEPIELGYAALTLPESGTISFDEFSDRLSKMKHLIRTIIGLHNKYCRPTQFFIGYHGSHIVPCIVRKMNKLMVDNMDLVDAFDCPRCSDIDASRVVTLGGPCVKQN